MTSAARAFSRLCMPATPVLRQYWYFCTSTHFTAHLAHFKLHACDADVDGLLVGSAAPRFGVLALGRNALRQHARAEAALHRLERRGRHFRGSFASVFVLLYQHSIYYSFRLRARKQRCTDLRAWRPTLPRQFCVGICTFVLAA